MRFSAFVTFAAVASTALASAIPQKRATATVYSKCTVPNTVALTFDDGPYEYMNDIVNTLDAAGAKGTFFYNGNNYQCIYSDANVSRLKYAYSHGHQVASHTWGHKDLTTLSWDQIHDEMWRVEQALQKILGVNPAFMRPPFGNQNQLVRDASGVRGQSIALWDLDTEDSLGATPARSKQIYDEAISRKPSTILSLAHETYERSAHEVLPYAIQKLKAAGYRLVTMAECVGKQPYQSVTQPGTKDSTWHC